jgi:hypothetical protein
MCRPGLQTGRKQELLAMRRLLFALTFVGIVAPAPGFAQQSFNIYLGGFAPASEDARSRNGGRSDDVLVNNLNFLSFNLEDFSNVTAGGEWLVGLGPMVDAGVGLGLYSKSVPSVYAELINDNGSEIEQELKLRIVPMTFTLRFLPTGHHSAVQPYIGAGVGIYRWRYSESGQFVDLFDNSIFRNSYVASGGASGPVILGGLRFPVGSWDIGGEVRYQNAEGKLPIDQGFSGSKIDLGGMNYLLTFNVRF